MLDFDCRTLAPRVRLDGLDDTAKRRAALALVRVDVPRHADPAIDAATVLAHSTASSSTGPAATSSWPVVAAARLDGAPGRARARTTATTSGCTTCGGPTARARPLRDGGDDE
jgi:hypothetical protein